MSEHTPADVLREAADVVRTEGWRRGYDGPGVCALRAIGIVTDDRGRTRAFWRAKKALGDLLGVTEHGGIATWNDEVAIDGEDVAVHMEKAAARWEETAGLTDSSAAGTTSPLGAAPGRLTPEQEQAYR